VACEFGGSGNGLDLNTTNNWIFPVQNYEKRKYQVDISRSSILQNTLVILPTGLGKTFIASVAIYNFMRFFPNAKVIFMAPTRPLVNQQMDACYDVVGISKEETAEMTGKIKKEKRVKLWDEKRLFFCTPQTLNSDIEEQTFPAHLIKLVVFDEAHKAKGNYAYCQVIKAIKNVQSNFRVLALTATAGKSKEIIDIIENLLISKIEFREENSIDVIQYTHKKKIECVEVKNTPELKKIIDRFMEFIDPNVKKLREAEIIKTYNVSKGYFLFMLKALHANPSISPQNKSEYSSLLSATIGLYNSLEMLQRFGIHLFLKSFRDTDGKFKFFVAMEPKLRDLIKELSEKYGNIFDGIHTSNQIKDYGHPKFELLRTKMKEYFDNDGAKVIIFSEFRDGTILINHLLQQMKPKVKSQILIGQGAKMNQREQIEIMKSFREGKVNTLVCTCVGEEGLDIGEVDLVICFDIANKVGLNLLNFNEAL
jgi:Fanconi anemia group M protein